MNKISNEKLNSIISRLLFEETFAQPLTTEVCIKLKTSMSALFDSLMSKFGNIKEPEIDAYIKNGRVKDGVLKYILVLDINVKIDGNPTVFTYSI